MPAKTVHIIDDDQEVLDSISFMLRTAGFTTTAHLSAEAYLEKRRELAAGCLLVDVRMPGMDGITLLECLHREEARLPVIIMTGHGDVFSAVRAMKAGAIDFIQKPFVKDDLMAAIAEANRRFEAPGPGDEARREAESRLAVLSRRERQVLEGLVRGHPNKTIAYDLGISARTVEVHRANAMKKLEVHSLPEMLQIAFLAGVMAPAGAREESA